MGRRIPDFLSFLILVLCFPLLVCVLCYVFFRIYYLSVVRKDADPEGCGGGGGAGVVVLSCNVGCVFSVIWYPSLQLCFCSFYFSFKKNLPSVSPNISAASSFIFYFWFLGLLPFVFVIKKDTLY